MILVLGASGQLGASLKKAAEKRRISDIVFPDERNANILNPGQLDRLLKEISAKAVINCAAYTAVDKAEEEKALAAEINVLGAKNVAESCKRNNAALVHISTDFVFKGNVPKLLNEEDPTEPLSEYGATKLAGEVAVRQILPEHYILRTSWLYSEFGNNFAKTMLRLGKERGQLSIVADQIGTPTYAEDLAETILEVINAKTKEYGIYHYSNEGAISWYDFAKAIFEISGIEVEATPIKTSEYITKASRPPFSVLDKTKIKQTFGIKPPYWRDSLLMCMKELMKATT